MVPQKNQVRGKEGAQRGKKAGIWVGQEERLPKGSDGL
jgi:hypothetical protein